MYEENWTQFYSDKLWLTVEGPDEPNDEFQQSASKETARAEDETQHNLAFLLEKVEGCSVSII